MRSQRAGELRWRLGFQNAFGVSSVGLSGGLVLLWKNNVTVDLKSYSKFHIDVWVTMENGRQWRFTGFYGEPVRARRKESWRLLRFLRNQTDLPWLCVGDFNEVLHEDEQMGGNDREEWCMEGFREAVDYCGFSDLGFRGLPYTWDNRREGSRNIKVRLDRGLADAAWLDLFGGSLVTHVQTAESDHCAILVQFRASFSLERGRGKPFRYENMWQRHHLYQDTGAGAWSSGCSSLNDVNANLGNLQSTLTRWGREEFGSVKNELRKLRQRLELIRSRTIRSGPAHEERWIMARLS